MCDEFCLVLATHAKKSINVPNHDLQNFLLFCHHFLVWSPSPRQDPLPSPPPLPLPPPPPPHRHLHPRILKYCQFQSSYHHRIRHHFLHLDHFLQEDIFHFQIEVDSLN